MRRTEGSSAQRAALRCLTLPLREVAMLHQGSSELASILDISNPKGARSNRIHQGARGRARVVERGSRNDFRFVKSPTNTAGI